MSRPVAFVLAGGQSRRFGCDKAQVQVGHRTMLDHVVAAVQPVVDAVAVVGGVGALPDGAQPVPDLRPGGGPVQAVVAANRAWPGRDWLLLGCDLPYLDTSLLAWLARPLAESALVRLPVLGARHQYLVSFWSAAAAPVFETGLAQGIESLRAIVRTLRTELDDEAAMLAAGLDPACLADVDTPADLRPDRQSS